MELAKLWAPLPRVLIFDTEARPTAWFGGDYVGKSMTAAAWIWNDDDAKPFRAAISREDTDTKSVVIPLLRAIKMADIVVGHFIRGYDLPLLSAELERNDLDPLEVLMTIDTKLDRKQQIGLSESLENLAARYELEEQKLSMNEPSWEEFNLWQTERSRTKVLDRVESDILSTRELYRELLAEGRLKGPKAWSPDQARMPRYRG